MSPIGVALVTSSGGRDGAVGLAAGESKLFRRAKPCSVGAAVAACLPTSAFSSAVRSDTGNGSPIATPRSWAMSSEGDILVGTDDMRKASQCH